MTEREKLLLRIGRLLLEQLRLWNCIEPPTCRDTEAIVREAEALGRELDKTEED